MITKSTPTKTILASLFVFVLFLCSMSCGPSGNTNNANGGTVLPTATASPSPTPVDCTRASSKEIIETIYRELEPLKLGEGAFDFNISAQAPPTLNIIGWSARKADILAVIKKIAPACTITTPVPPTFVDTESELPAPYQRLGCSGGLKPCGDVCIPVDQICAWAGMVYKTAATSTPSPSPTPGANSNASTNTATANSGNTNTAKKP